MQAIEIFLKVVTNNEFVEGHEVLEDLWNLYKKDPQTEKEGKILKGLINGSTALALASKGKVEGAQRVWQTFEKYRPLIHLVSCENTTLYKEAEALLDSKKLFYL